MNFTHKENDFKSCSSCHTSWKSQDNFLSDPSLEMVGYQVHFKDLEEGLFLFNHHICKSTISVKSGKFKNLYDGPLFTENKSGSENCPEYCIYKTNLQACPEQCECAYVREIIQTIKNWPKLEIKVKI